MTKDEIIKMAEKVYGKCDWHDSALSHLEQFAKLVTEREREACAKIVDVQNMASKFTYKKQLETKDELVSCAECGADGGHALYCVACAEKFVKREWVGLTDKEVDECLQGLPTQTIDVYARRIEIKIKEKNT